MGYAAIVLAGGEGRRMGGVLKPLLPIRGEPILARVIAAVNDADQLVVVGPPALEPHLPPEATRTREDPPGGGPVAGLAAGFELCRDADEIAVVAGDLPFLTASALQRLRRRDADVAVFVDDEGRWQSMVSVWRGGALARALQGVPVKMKDLLSGAERLSATRWAGAQPPPWFDCDTPEDLRQAERLS